MSAEVCRTSRRLVRAEKAAGVDDEASSQSHWSDESGESAPDDDPVWREEDKRWRQSCLHKCVYFRWSTAFNSKNRYRGIVTGHRSRVDTRGVRVDYLTIKTFGSTEDRYVMGKDIRELHVLPNKTSLMEAGTDEEVRARAVRKWCCKENWIELPDIGDSLSTAGQSTQAHTPVIPAKRKRENPAESVVALKVVPVVQSGGKSVPTAKTAPAPKPVISVKPVPAPTKATKAVPVKATATVKTVVPSKASTTPSLVLGGKAAVVLAPAVKLPVVQDSSAAKRVKRPPSFVKPTIASSPVAETPLPPGFVGVYISTQHARRSMAGRIGKFCFFN